MLSNKTINRIIYVSIAMILILFVIIAYTMVEFYNDYRCSTTSSIEWYINHNCSRFEK